MSQSPPEQGFNLAAPADQGRPRRHRRAAPCCSIGTALRRRPRPPRSASSWPTHRADRSDIIARIMAAAMQEAMPAVVDHRREQCAVSRRRPRSAWAMSRAPMPTATPILLSTSACSVNRRPLQQPAV